MSLEDLLRGQLQAAYGKKLWDENPLITIGLSRDILSLRVSDEQLYKIVRGYTRQLAAAVHPDRESSPELAADQERIFVAFNLLDDYNTFLSALQEFKKLKSDERSQENLLRQSLATTKRELEKTRAQLSDQSVVKKLLEQERVTFENQKLREGLELPALRLRLEASERLQCRSHRLLCQRAKLNKSLLEFIDHYRAFLLASRYVPDTLDPKKVGTTIAWRFPHEVTEITVVSFFFRDVVRTTENSSRTEVTPHMKPAQPRLLSLSDEFLPEDLKAAYQMWLPRIEEMIWKKPGDEEVKFVLQKLAVKNGVLNAFEESTERMAELPDERVVGSISLESVASSPYKKRAISNLPPAFVARNIVPFLAPGSILISTPTFKIKPKDDPTLFSIEKMMERCSKMRGGFKSNRLILGVS